MKKFNNRQNKSYNVDGKLIWESRSVALVGVVLIEQGGTLYVLLSQRGKGSADYQGLWNVPCGYLDWDENGYDGVCREIYEETGLDVLNWGGYCYGVKQPFYVNTEITENRQNVALSYGILLKTFESLPQLTTEHSDPNEVEQAKWVRVEDLDKYDFAFCHDKRIKHFLKIIEK